MRRFLNPMCVAPVLTIGLLFAGCKQRQESPVDTLKGGANGHVTLEDPAYKALVESKKYPEALNYVCNKFPQLDCSKVRLVNRANTGAYAITGLGNKITIYPSAFVHKQSGAILPGWLAAVIWHEMTHVKQSKYIRWIVNGAQQRILGNYRYDAGLELEGWQSMIEPDQFPMNCSMLLEIEGNIYYFYKVLENNGRRPISDKDEDDNYTMSTKNYGKFLNECRAKQNARGLVAPITGPSAVPKANDIITPEVKSDLDSKADSKE